MNVSLPFESQIRINEEAQLCAGAICRSIVAAVVAMPVPQPMLVRLLVDQMLQLRE